MTEHNHQGGLVTGPNGEIPTVTMPLSPGERVYKITDGQVVDVTPVAEQSKDVWTQLEALAVEHIARRKLGLLRCHPVVFHALSSAAPDDGEWRPDWRAAPLAGWCPVDVTIALPYGGWELLDVDGELIAEGVLASG